MTDAVSYIAPDYSFSSSLHLASPDNPLYSRLEPGKIWYPKNPSSMMPGDLNTFDDQWVYQKLTEQDWTKPNSYKAFVSSNWPGGGIPFCPRWLDLTVLSPPVITSDSSYQIHSDCMTYVTQNLQQVQTQALGVVNVALGGDLGTLPCLVISYQWGNGMVRETFYYAQHYGWVQWSTANLVNGQYVMEKTVTFNTVAAGGFQGAEFPCLIP